MWSPPPPFFFLPSPVFSCLPSLPVGQSEDRSDGSSSGAGAGAGPGESSVLLATDALGVFLLINGHRSNGRTCSPCRQWEVSDVSSADATHLNYVYLEDWWLRHLWCGETDSELHRQVCFKCVCNLRCVCELFWFHLLMFVFSFRIIFNNGETKPVCFVCTKNYCMINFHWRQEKWGTKSIWIFLLKPELSLLCFNLPFSRTISKNVLSL